MFPVFKLSRENTQPENVCDIILEKAKGVYAEATVQSRPVETGGVGKRLVGGCSPPRFLLNSIFYALKEIALKWKIIQNWKTTCPSKFIGIYNIIIEFDTRDGISCQ